MLDDIDFLVGVDGSGASMRVVVVHFDHQPIGASLALMTSASQGVAAAWHDVQEAVEGVFRDVGLAFEPARCGIGLGLPGANDPAWLRDFYSAAPPYRRVRIDTDDFAMLLGAHAGAAGALVASGTGSVGEALLRDGTRRIVGGWGHPIGGEGSGAWLGLHAMRAAQHARDGRAAAGPLAKAVWEQVGDSAEALREWSMHAGAGQLAELAPLVLATQSRDPYARQLVEGAVQALLEIGNALDPHQDLPLVIGGPIGRALMQHMPVSLLARCREPLEDAAHGALYLLTRPRTDPDDSDDEGPG